MTSADNTMLHTTTPQHHRFHLLDGLRGVAAVLVALRHGTIGLDVPVLANNGPLAVDFFFCLSGFVIAFSYEKRLLAGLSVRDFFAARVIRLYPAYWLCITLSLALTTFLSSSHWYPGKRLLFFYVQAVFFIPVLFKSLTWMPFPLDNAAWSLFFEFVANGIYAWVVVRGLLRSWLLSLVAALSFAWMLMAVIHGNPIWTMGWQNDLSKFTLGLPRVGLSFSLGVLIYHFYRAHKPETFSRVLGLPVTALLLFLLVAPFAWMESRLFTLLCVSLLLPGVVLAGAFARVPASLAGFCSALGEISYPLYLLHLVMLPPMIALGKSAAEHHAFLSVWIAPTAVSLISLLSLFVARKIDAPIRQHILRQYKALVTSPQR